MESSFLRQKPPEQGKDVLKLKREQQRCQGKRCQAAEPAEPPGSLHQCSGAAHSSQSGSLPCSKAASSVALALPRRRMKQSGTRMPRPPCTISNSQAPTEPAVTQGTA